MNKCIQAGVKVISPDNLFVIAEVGNQFNGDMATTYKLVQAAKYAGADCIKFIFWFPDEIMCDKSQLYTYQTATGPKTEPMFDLLSRYTLTLDKWFEVREWCDKAGLVMMATVISPTGMEWAIELDLPAYKISSWDYGFKDLWERVGASGAPIFIDTGPCYMHELAEGIHWIEEQKNYNIVLMHTFHTKKPYEMNMRSIPYLEQTFGCLVGYCPTDWDSYLDATAIGLGAVALEKRLTLTSGDGVLHSAISLEPEGFKAYVETMRRLKDSLGGYRLTPSVNDLEERKKWFRHIVADVNIVKGETITRDMLEAKRGEDGTSPKYIDFMLGHKAKRDFARNEAINLEDLA